MRSKITRILFVLVACLVVMSVLLPTGCSKKESQEPTSFKIGIVTPSLSDSEEEYRGAELVADKYPGRVNHIVLPENFGEELETAITQISSLGDDPDIKAVVICAGYEGILAGIQQLKEKRPDMVVVTAPIWDDPDMMAQYIDLCLDTDWVQRGITIPTKAYQMGARTFIHYSFPTHMAKEVIATRRDLMKQTCASLNMTFVEVLTPDPQAGGGSVAAMLQFLGEDIPRQIDTYGVDTCVFGTNCPMQDVIIAKALELKYIFAEQCCPTPLQGYPAAMGLEIPEDDAFNFDLVNEMISEKAAEAGMTGRLSTWPVSVSVFFPQFASEVAMGMVEGTVDKDNISIDQLESIAFDIAGVDVTFNEMDPDLDNYYLIIMDSIIY
jgi:hypothetical protein